MSLDPRWGMCVVLAVTKTMIALPTSPPALGASQSARAADTAFRTKGPCHRATFPIDSRALAGLRAAGAVHWVEEYRAFTLACIDERIAGAPAMLRAEGVQIVDEMALIEFNGYRLDGADLRSTESVLASIPDSLRAPDAPSSRGESRLQVVQFVGPIKGVWLEALRETKSFIITYAASNAYVVKVDQAADAALAQFAKRPYVLSVLSYEPAFKLRPELRPPTLVETEAYDVIVQVIADAEGTAFAESLRLRAIAMLSAPDPVLNYMNISLRMDGANVLELARDPHVFAIEPKLEARMLDERQGQIVAGNLDPTGSQPSGPGYLAWLASLGFPGTNPFDFVVDVEDSGIDRGATQATERVSVDSVGVQGNGGSESTSISADGRYVAFASQASNLVALDTNGKYDIFVTNRQSGTTERVSVATGGAQGNGHSGISEDPALSADGRFVAFASDASNLVSGDTNGAPDIFVHDRQSGGTQRVSVSTSGAQVDQWAQNIAISADGRCVAFDSPSDLLVAGDTNGTYDVFVHDRQDGTTERVSVATGGAQSNQGSKRPSISADGRFVAFDSGAANFVIGDTNAYEDIFVRDRQLGTTERVSVDSSGTQGDRWSKGPSISADGRFVAFESRANNLVVGDTNFSHDMFVRDRQLGTTERVSVSTSGAQGNGDSGFLDLFWGRVVSISIDGRYVAFVSDASNLVSGDTNGITDIFVRDRQTGVTARVSGADGGSQGNGPSYGPSISADGQSVAYWSLATNLVPVDTNGVADVFVRAADDINNEFRVDGQASRASRVAYNYNYSGDPLADDQRGHGTINASIVGGYNSSDVPACEDVLGYQYGLGMAPWVKIGSSKVFNNAGSAVFNQSTLTRMSNAYNAGARISSNSWVTSLVNPYAIHNVYDTDSQSHDVAVRDSVSGAPGNQEMAIVFSVGNDGMHGGSSVHPPGTAKNVITVGASENWRMDGTDGCPMPVTDVGANDARELASFSSQGPTSDLRTKPEILAPGTHIQGAASQASGYTGNGTCGLPDPISQYWPTGQTLYTWSSGTSHAAPAIAGACALVRQWFLNRSLTAPSPAMTKALLIVGATYMSGSGANDTLWSNAQGMGRVDLGMTFDTIPRILIDQTTVLGATDDYDRFDATIANSSAPVRIVLAWTDAPGPSTGHAYCNNLDLVVKVNGTLYSGNVFSGSMSSPGGLPDMRNNLESVFLPSGTTGALVIAVLAVNIGADGVPGNADLTDQDFALVVYNGVYDCNHNSRADDQDIALGTSLDSDGNGVPDECEPGALHPTRRR